MLWVLKRTVSFKHTKHMFKWMGKKIIVIKIFAKLDVLSSIILILAKTIEQGKILELTC